MRTETQDYTYSYESSGASFSVADSVAAIRKNIAPFRFGLAAKEIVSTLELTETDRTLELGSGLGLLAEQITGLTGGDSSYVGVELAFRPARESKDRGLVPLQADITALPFADESFSALVSTDVLEHVPDATKVLNEMNRILKPGGKGFVVIADPSEGRFHFVHDHIDRSQNGGDVEYWETKFGESGFRLDSNSSEHLRRKDWRRVFNLPVLISLKDKAGFACAFNPVYRPGVYIVEKPAQ